MKKHGFRYMGRGMTAAVLAAALLCGSALAAPATRSAVSVSTSLGVEQGCWKITAFIGTAAVYSEEETNDSVIGTSFYLSDAETVYGSEKTVAKPVTTKMTYSEAYEYYRIDPERLGIEQGESGTRIESGSLSAVVLDANTMAVARNGKFFRAELQKGQTFLDVPASTWYCDAVEDAAASGWITGTSAAEFSPAVPMSRAMLVTVLWRMAGKPLLADYVTGFTDQTGDWYYDAVNWASQTKIVSGTSQTTFSPNQNITREQLAVLLRRYAEATDRELSGTAASAGAFPDYNSISAYARDAMTWAVSGGVISGKNGNRLDPQGTASRAEVAAMLQRFEKNAVTRVEQ